MNILEAIKTRRSVRSYNGMPLTDVMKNALEEAMANTYSPFGGKVGIRLKEFDMGRGYRPSTYGMIKGATDFFLISMGDDEGSALSAGFRFEQVVLRATELGLGTCWIAATFKGSDFERGELWLNGEELRIVSPVGFASGQSFVERMARAAFGSKKREPFADLFFTDNFKCSLAENSRFGASLGMLRLAPSSTNSQPWRALVDGDMVHFYYKPKSKLSILDCGIGFCHFYETEVYNGNAGTFYKHENAPAAPDNWKYLYSYRSGD